MDTGGTDIGAKRLFPVAIRTTEPHDSRSEGVGKGAWPFGELCSAAVGQLCGLRPIHHQLRAQRDDSGHECLSACTPQQKLNPENGICLSALYDKAFDQGLITISPDDYSVVLSAALREYESQDYFDKHFRSICGKTITMPIEHQPNRDFLAYHRDKIFLGL